jgi:hypothetical protein
VASPAIPNPSHSWELFAEHPDVQVGITGIYGQSFAATLG